jgi:predicted GNAT family N-acyltransferase
MQKCLIKEVNWNSPEQAQLKAVREVVFIQEQHVPLYIEWDEFDETAIHLLALDAQGNAIGCARILPEKGRIGRMAVLKEWRGQGLGQVLLDKALEICKMQGLQTVKLSSQTHAIRFYEQAGFKITSEAYIDANIWHVDMERAL